MTEDFETVKEEYLNLLTEDIERISSDIYYAVQDVQDAKKAHTAAQSRYDSLIELDTEKRVLYRMITGEEYCG
jgi:hypothetical protein